MSTKISNKNYNQYEVLHSMTVKGTGEKEVKENNDKRFQRIVVGNYHSNLLDKRITTEQNREYLVLNDIVYFLVDELDKVRQYLEWCIIDDEEEKKKVFSEIIELRKSLSNVTQVTYNNKGVTK